MQDLIELQRQQLSGEAKTIKANKNGEYDIAEADQDRIHVRLSRKVNNPATQTYDEQSRIEAVDVHDFAQLEKNNAFHTAGWTDVEIIHDPRNAAVKKEAAATEGFVEEMIIPAPSGDTFPDAVEYKEPVPARRSSNK